MSNRLSRVQMRELKRKRRKKLLIVVLALAGALLVGFGIYCVADMQMKAQKIAEEKEARAKYESNLNEAIDESLKLCPQVLQYVGEKEEIYKSYVDNINNSSDIYERIANANSLIKTAAFYLDQYMAVAIDEVEAGEDVDVQYNKKTTEYNSSMNELRNKFAENWYGFMGVAGESTQSASTAE